METGTGIAPIRIAARYRTTNVGPVGGEHQQPLLWLQPELAQHGGGPLDPVEQLGVGQLPAHAGDGQPAAVTSLHAAVQQVLARVKRADGAGGVGSSPHERY